MSDELYGHDYSADLSFRHHIDDSRKQPIQQPLLTWVNTADARHCVHLMECAVKSVLRSQMGRDAIPARWVDRTKRASRDRGKSKTTQKPKCWFCRSDCEAGSDSGDPIAQSKQQQQRAYSEPMRKQVETWQRSELTRMSPARWSSTRRLSRASSKRRNILPESARPLLRTVTLCKA
jgi:hypothetical protein